MHNHPLFTLKILLPECFDVSCSVTVDNVVDGISYEGSELTVSGELGNWRSEKTFNFSTCDRTNPGQLVVNGTDSNSNNFCRNAGMILHCECEDAFNPWHNFITDIENWKVDDGSEPCTEDTGFIPAAINQNIQFITDMIDQGASKIWSDAKVVSLAGTPGMKLHYIQNF